MPGSLYELRVEGFVAEDEADALYGFVATAAPPESLLRGQVSDPAALHRVVQRLESLGLRITEIRRIGDARLRATGPGRARP